MIYLDLNLLLIKTLDNEGHFVLILSQRLKSESI